MFYLFKSYYTDSTILVFALDKFEAFEKVNNSDFYLVKEGAVC
jgi:hypothetical protein